MDPNISTPNQTPAGPSPAPAETPPAAQPPANTPATGPQAGPPKKRMSKSLLLGLVLVLIIIAVAAYFAFGRKSSPTATTTQKSTKVYKVGILDTFDNFFGTSVKGFEEKMTELGYVQGKNITYDVVKTPNLTGNQPTIRKFISEKDDLVVSWPTEASLETKSVLKNSGIPMIFDNAAAEGSGLITSVQQPGNNITGVRYPVPEIAVKRLDTLHELVPAAKRIWLPVLKDYPSVPAAVAAANNEAKNLGVTLTTAAFASPDELKAYLAKLPASGDVGMDAIVEVAEPLSVTPDAYNAIDQFAFQHKLPLGGSTPTQDASSPMFVIFPNPEITGQLAATLADKIFKGTPAGNIPVVTPGSDTIVNLKSMNHLGITPSQGFLSTASQIIK